MSNPVQTITLDGVEVRVDGPSRAVVWMSDWARCWDLVDAGLLRAVDRGPRTHGHADFYVA